MVETRVVVFISSMTRSRKAGIIRLTAWGRMIRRRTSFRVMPMANPASHCPFSMDMIPALKTSAKNAEDWMEKVSDEQYQAG